MPGRIHAERSMLAAAIMPVAGRYGFWTEPMTKYQPFPNTHWSLVKRAGLPDQAARQEALRILLERYLPALRYYLQTVRGMSEDEADELLQSFIAERILTYDL